MRNQNTPEANYCRLVALAKHKGYQMELTFEEWWQCWDESGMWEFKGKGKDDYCLGRLDKTLPFRPDNISIRTIGDNISMAHAGKAKTEEQKDKMSLAHKGKKFTDEHCDNISKALTGHPQAEERKAKMRGPRGPRKGTKVPERKVCPHCQGKFSGALYSNYHGDNCKNK